MPHPLHRPKRRPTVAPIHPRPLFPNPRSRIPRHGRPLRPERRRAADLRPVGGRGRVRRRARPGPRAVRDRAAASERDRRPPHGPRRERELPGHPDPAAADAGPRLALDLRHRPCGDRRARGDRQAAPGRGAHPLGPRPRAVPRAGVAMARGDRRHDHRPVQAARVLARLRPRAVHDGRGLRRRGAHDVRRALPQGLHPPRQPHDQLVPDVRLDDLRPRGALRARGRHAV